MCRTAPGIQRKIGVESQIPSDGAPKSHVASIQAFHHPWFAAPVGRREERLAGGEDGVPLRLVIARVASPIGQKGPGHTRVRTIGQENRFTSLQPPPFGQEVVIQGDDDRRRAGAFRVFVEQPIKAAIPLVGQAGSAGDDHHRIGQALDNLREIIRHVSRFRGGDDNDVRATALQGQSLQKRGQKGWPPCGGKYDGEHVQP